MDNHHIIPVTYSGSGSYRTREVYQYDYGQILSFDGFDLPDAFEVHFYAGGGESVTVIGHDDQVDIPDSLLQIQRTVTVWLFLHDTEDDGETRFVVEIPVRGRSAITDEEPTPVEQSVITQAIAALNAGVEAAEDAQGAAEAAQASAESYAESAGNSAITATNAATSAATSAGNAAASATSAGSSATDANASRQAADLSATNAGISERNAAASATAAAGSATSAAASAGQASASATAASGSASTASAKAGEAAQSATAAAGSAASASENAGTASTAATAAGQSATAAAGSATAAAGSATSAGQSATAAAGSAQTAQAVLDSIPADYSTLSDDVSDLKSAIDALDVYGADNRTPDKTGTFYPGSLTVVCNKNVFSISGSPTGSGQTHFDIYNNSSTFPAGISAGMPLQLTQVCSNSKIHFKFYERVNDTNSMLCDIPGDGTAQININASATGCIIRISVDNGNTYSNVESSVYILGTLTKQQIQDQFANNVQEINTVDNKISTLKAYMPTAGNKQFIDIENAQIINARVADSTSRLIADNAYKAIIVPAAITAQNTYWAKLFAESVTLNEIKLYTFNDVNIGTSIAVNNSNSYSAVNKQSRVQTTASASYFVLVLHLGSGTIEDALNGAVIALSNDAPAEYQSYYISVDDAIKNADYLSPDSIHVGKDAGYYQYTDINSAVVAHPSEIIGVAYGTYETEVQDLTTNKKLIGKDVDLCILSGTNKDYDTPPIEIAGGIIKNFTINMVNNESVSHKGYCIHSDNAACANNTLTVENCKFNCTGQHAIGMGIYPGETVIYKNCEFVFPDEEAEPTHAPFFAHNSGASDGLATIRFDGCVFRGSSYAIKLSAYSSNCTMKFEFIGCTCQSETLVGEEMVWTDYVTGSTHDQSKLHIFTGKMILMGTSHGNNVSLLNAT